MTRYSTSFSSNNFKNFLKSWGSRIVVSIGGLTHQFKGEKAFGDGGIAPMSPVRFVGLFEAGEGGDGGPVYSYLVDIHVIIIPSP